MTDEQLDSFKLISEEQHLRFKKMLAGGKRTGRPPKPLDEKEHIHAIRFSDQLVQRIKEKAVIAGLPWQTFMKKILSEELDKK
jgi:predicted DNA binding CopG/RHH family protein